MAKPLGLKTRLIREAISANPTVQNKALAEQINSSDARQQDQIKVTPFEVAQQRQRLKKLEAAPPAVAAPAAAQAAPAPAKTSKKRGRPKGSLNTKAASAPARVTAPAPNRVASPVDLIDRLLDFAEDVGGLGALKRLVDRLAPMR